VSPLAPGLVLISMLPSECAPQGVQFAVSFDALTHKWQGTLDPALAELQPYSGSTTLSATVSRDIYGHFLLAFKLTIVDEDSISCPIITPLVSC
jgi:hypothetical protein